MKDLVTKRKIFILVILLVVLVVSAYFSRRDKDNSDQIISYTTPLLDVDEFRRDLIDAQSDTILAPLANAFYNFCDTSAIGSATFGPAKTFRQLVQLVTPVKTLSDGSEVLIFPCGQGSYQSYYLFVLQSANNYKILQIPMLTKEGVTERQARAVEMSYDLGRDLFVSTVSGNGQHTCWQTAEHKLIGNELVLQRFEADWNCEDGKREGKVIFDITE